VTELDSHSDDHQVASALLDDGKYEEAFERYRKLADAGSITAQLLVGWMYHAGQGVKQNLDEARRWYKKAADSNSAEGQFYLGGLYRSEHQYEEAIAWLQKSVAQEYVPALYRLGRMHDIGEGVDLDKDKAYRYLEQAAKMGHLFARREVAVKMIKGRGGLINIFKGLYMFARVLCGGAKVASRDPDSDMIRR